MQLVLDPEALRGANQGRSPHLVAFAEIEQHVRGQAAVEPVSLTEVHRQLQRLDVTGRPDRPAEPGCRESEPMLPTTFIVASPLSPSSASRSVSSIHVENVVNDPSVAVPAISMSSPVAP